MGTVRHVCTTWEWCQVLTKGFTAQLWEKALTHFALKCFRNIWHWIVWPTIDKSVKPFGFVTRQHVSTHFWFLYRSLFLCLSLSVCLTPLPAFNPTVKWDVYLMTHNLQFVWLLPFYVANLLCELCDFTMKAKLKPIVCIFCKNFVPLVGACKQHFVTSWFLFCLPFSLLSFPLGSAAKVGREERRAWPRNCSQAPAPVRVGLLAGTLLSLSLVLQAKERDVEMHSCLFSNPPFFLSPPPWPNSLRVNSSLTCTKKLNSRYFRFLILLLFGPWYSSLYLSLPLLIFCCTFTRLLLSPSTLYTCLLCLHRTQCLNLHHFCSTETHWDLVLNNVVTLVRCIKK